MVARVHGVDLVWVRIPAPRLSTKYFKKEGLNITPNFYLGLDLGSHSTKFKGSNVFWLISEPFLNEAPDINF